MFLATLP